ncbi:signal transduction histidine kinase [Peribacillus deserti]|uniref:histidine kinase n=1 Tax=Peribacillus deserti TaxID=673318 RepID=A0ABS2QHL9_9BACI|nr:HAMP domain-containing sensor histidine kinase [Peribacillus deserti]MBM7692455.1 signal transduction histidine kinase [Peribacillus deserti]
MRKGLHARLALIFTLIASAVLILTSIIYALEIHYHFTMFQHESATIQHLDPLSSHLERAMLESILFTAIAAIILVFIVSYFVAKRLSNPLLQMREAAEKMTKGQWKTRVKISGNDELSELGHSLNQLALELENQEIARKNMTADIAHELRKPLTTLKSHMEAFEDGIWEPTLERIKDCTEEINRLIHLIQDLEQLNTIESPEFRMNFKENNLGGVIKHCIVSVTSAYLQKNVDVQANSSDNLNFPFDEERMKQILFNLLSNSLKYTPAGGLVRVSAENKGDHVLISVKDNGTGMRKKSLEKVFDRFYREDRSRSRDTGGSGIGLTIVRRLVEAHQGTVWIESTEGMGTIVYIQLPKN